MVIAAVLTANLCNGLNTNVWTAWVFFAVFLGIVLVWIFTVIYSLYKHTFILNSFQAIYSVISPGWFATNAFGNDHYLFRSAYFWLCLPITILFALLPRYLIKAWRFGYIPNDIDIVRWNRKMEPDRDLAHDAYFAPPLAAMRRSNSMRRSTSRRSTSRQTRPVSVASRADSVATIDITRPPDMRGGSRTDMSTGQRSVNRGFDFATEEGGVAMRRMQSNLSERRQSSRNLPLPETDQTKRKGSMRLFSLRRAARRKPSSPQKPGSPKKNE